MSLLLQGTISRTKEIGIRKVNGAGFLEIIRWLLHDILYMIAASLVISILLSFYLASVWLDNYA
jgi:putative ABC transport system permease protein